VGSGLESEPWTEVTLAAGRAIEGRSICKVNGDEGLRDGIAAACACAKEGRGGGARAGGAENCAGIGSSLPSWCCTPRTGWSPGVELPPSAPSPALSALRSPVGGSTSILWLSPVGGASNVSDGCALVFVAIGVRENTEQVADGV